MAIDAIAFEKEESSRFEVSDAVSNSIGHSRCLVLRLQTFHRIALNRGTSRCWTVCYLRARARTLLKCLQMFARPSVRMFKKSVAATLPQRA